jgi:hypothetical protein
MSRKIKWKNTDILCPTLSIPKRFKHSICPYDIFLNIRDYMTMKELDILDSWCTE